MSKFRRVSELTTPEFMEKAVDSQYSGDPYAALKKTQASRRQQIAQNAKNYKMSQADTPYEWEQEPEPSMYQNYTFPKDDESYQNENLGSNKRIVRKSDYGTDQDFTARDVEAQLKFFTEEQYTNALMRGSASIWNPNMQEIVEAFKNSQNTQSEEAFMSAEVKESIRQSKINAWENKALREASKSKYATSRANPLLRTANEMAAGGQMGIIDWGELDSNEQQRLKMRENRRAQRAAITRRGSDRDSVHQEWEDSIDMHTPTAKEYYGEYGIDLLIDNEY